jgi:hypothetical protein
MGNRTSSHGVISTNTTLFINDHERSTGSTKLITHRTALEPFVQGVFTAFEFIQQMRGYKRLGY